MAGPLERPFARYALAVLGVLLVAGIIAWRLDAMRWVATDNAYVEADTAAIGPQIEGFVAEILVADNEVVAKGQPLVLLDRADAEARLAEAEAALAVEQASAGGLAAETALKRSRVAEKAAAILAAEAEARVAAADLNRARALSGRGLVSPQRIEAAAAGAEQAGAGVRQAAAALEAERRAVRAALSSHAGAAARIAAAQARLDQARRDLERTTIRAPLDGVIGARAARLGQFVRPGTMLMAVVPVQDVYVVANFKETQVAKLRIGQRVKLEADAFPGATIEGRVESFAPASGSEFALIPVEHASGNFTRITQRLPVRVTLKESAVAALRPGLSVRAKVDVQSPGGPGLGDAVRPAPALATAQ
jgi:membrane fusion protein (multidrug efflux system)